MGRHRHPISVDFVVDQFSREGHGMGKVSYPEGKQSLVEVPFSIPGDRIKALLIDRYRGVYQGKLEEILQPSSDRVMPLCIHFGSCGGCRWQQISYEKELQQKTQWVQQALAPYLSATIPFYPILPCVPPWQYRNKMELSFSADKEGHHYLGLILFGSRGRVFNMEECHLIHPWYVEAVKAVRSWWDESGLDAYHLRRGTGSLRTLILREGRRSGDRLAMLTVSGDPEFALYKKQLNAFIDALRKAVEPSSPERKFSIFLRIQQIAKGRPTQFYEMHLYGPDHLREILHIQEEGRSLPTSLFFHISPSAFFQPNTEQAERMYTRALQMVQIPKDALVYDLYCGTGTLGICAAKQAKEVIGMELSPESVVDARENIKLNQISNMKVLQGDVGHLLVDLAEQDPRRPDVVMVDPPRAGLDPKAIQSLLKLKAPKLLYISCNPITQAANLEVLINGGYQLQAVQPVDQFPHTVHIENIVVLNYVT